VRNSAQDAAHVDPRARLTPAEGDAQAACLAAYGAQEGMVVFTKVFNEPKVFFSCYIFVSLCLHLSLLPTRSMSVHHAASLSVFCF